MKFICPDHGRQERVQHDGYSLAHSSEIRASPSDLEGIKFVFDVVSNPDGGALELELDTVRGNYGNYLSKFHNWEEEVTAVAEGEMEHACPECGNGALLYWLTDGEDMP